jgi:hypothetical protein
MRAWRKAVAAPREIRGAGSVPIALVHIQGTEDAVELLPIEVVGIRKVGLAKERDALKHTNEPGRIPVRQRFEQCRVDKGENGHAGAHSERQHDDRRGGESKVLSQLPNRKANIVKQVL